MQKKFLKTLIPIALVLIFTLIGFFNGATFGYLEYRQDRLESIQEDLQLYKTAEEYEAIIAEKEAELPGLKSAQTAAKSALDQAMAARKLVCTRTSYSHYFCADPATCKPLHDAVSEKDALHTRAKSLVTYAENDIEKAEQNIEHLATLKADAAAARGKIAGYIVRIVIQGIGTLLCVAALGYFALCLPRETHDKPALLACAGMAAGSLLLLFTVPNFGCDSYTLPAFGKFIFSPYLWNIVAFALFALILKKGAECPKKFRIFTIVAIVVMFIQAPTRTGRTGAALIAYLLYTILLFTFLNTLMPVKIVRKERQMRNHSEYVGIAKHIFLSLITLGIWPCIWIYRTTRTLNKANLGLWRTPGTELLLVIFLPFYGIYWTYKTAELTEAYGAQNGKEFKISILCLALMFISPLFATVIIQDKINQIVAQIATKAE